jgi:hypothetical protein
LKRVRRGISTIVTSVMLVSAVSMMGTFVLSWSSSGFAAQRVAVSDTANDRVNQIREDVVLEDVWFFANSTSSYAKVTVRNAGELAVDVSSIHVNNTRAWGDGKVIMAGTTGDVTFASAWSAGSAQDIWVVTKRGTEVKQLWRS